VFTIFTVPKPFRGHIGDIQRNAVESWRALHPDVQVVLVGDEEGVKDAARDAGVDHAAGLARSARGTPRLDSAFERAGQLSRWSLWCFVNADIVLLDDFPAAVERVASAFSHFLMVGETRNLHVSPGAHFADAAVRSQLRSQALSTGRLRGYAALDYFVFRAGLFDPVPPFLIGRACFDNWLVWRARELHRPVVDATHRVIAVHQSHDYSHVAGGFEEAYYGEEARHNEHLAGGRDHIYSLHDATHRLYRYGPPVQYWGSHFRLREKARLAKVSIDIQLAARRARKEAEFLEEPTIRLLGVFPKPRADTTLVLDALAEHEKIDLNVLYPETASDRRGTAQPRQHIHWYARSTRIPKIETLLGREYPITWTIWHSFFFLRPDCMLISGWDTFPAQAAIAWCTVRRLPYLLLIEEDGAARLRRDGGVSRALLGAVARKSVGVLVQDPTTYQSILAYGVGAEHIYQLPAGTGPSVTRILDLVRDAPTRPTITPRATPFVPRPSSRIRPSVLRRTRGSGHSDVRVGAEEP
jgi:hypothetical protein